MSFWQPKQGTAKRFGLVKSQGSKGAAKPVAFGSVGGGRAPAPRGPPAAFAAEDGDDDDFGEGPQAVNRRMAHEDAARKRREAQARRVHEARPARVRLTPPVPRGRGMR